jgi:hypothetical protein
MLEQNYQPSTIQNETIKTTTFEISNQPIQICSREHAIAKLETIGGMSFEVPEIYFNKYKLTNLFVPGWEQVEHKDLSYYGININFDINRIKPQNIKCGAVVVPVTANVIPRLLKSAFPVILKEYINSIFDRSRREEQYYRAVYQACVMHSQGKSVDEVSDFLYNNLPESHSAVKFDKWALAVTLSSTMKALFFNSGAVSLDNNPKTVVIGGYPFTDPLAGVDNNPLRLQKLKEIN